MINLVESPKEELVVEDSFFDDLIEFCSDDESEMLNISVTGNKEEDARKIQNMHQANYFLKLHKLMIEEEKKIEEFVKIEMQNYEEVLKAYKRKALSPITRKKEYFEYVLREFAQHELEGSKKKSVALPHGTLAFSKPASEWNYYDEDMVMGFLKSSQMDNLIRVKTTEAIDKKELKKMLDVRGTEVFLNDTLIEGIQVIEKADTFKIK